MTPVGFYNPAVLAKKAATVDEISGGRLMLGPGAGWNDVEFRGYGVPFDNRISRFEEAFTIIRTLLRKGEIDFEGKYFNARDCQLVPRCRPGGPPILIGSIGERMLRITLPFVQALGDRGAMASAGGWLGTMDVLASLQGPIAARRHRRDVRALQAHPG